MPWKKELVFLSHRSPKMASKFTTSLYPNYSFSAPFLISKHKQVLIKLYPSPSFSSSRTLAQSEGAEISRLADQQDNPTSVSAGSFSSARAQLDLLEQLTSTSSSVNGYESDGNSIKLTIRDQLAQLFSESDGDFSIPLGKNLKKVSAKFLTVSQKRNIRRQAYLNEASKRNDSVFFATIGAFIILPPLIILGIAIATGYVQLFP